MFIKGVPLYFNMRLVMQEIKFRVTAEEYKIIKKAQGSESWRAFILSLVADGGKN